MGDAVSGRAGAARALALLPLLPVSLLVSGCRDHRSVAVSELERLDAAMQQHATRYGSFPETIDSDRPITHQNLPYSQERNVSVRLVGTTSQSYAATARSGVWLCGVRVGRGQRAVPDCVPTEANSSPGGEDIRSPDHLEQIFDEPGAPGDSLTGS